MNKAKTNPHRLFWSLLKNEPDYEDRYKDLIKEGLVNSFSNGKTCSLSEMYSKFPTEYSLMIEDLKKRSSKRKERQEVEADLERKRVIAAISSWLDKLEYEFKNPSEKIVYVKSIACRAANCSDFNKIPPSRLNAIYQLYCKKNSVKIEVDPITDYYFSKN